MSANEQSECLAKKHRKVEFNSECFENFEIRMQC